MNEDPVSGNSGDDLDEATLQSRYAGQIRKYERAQESYDSGPGGQYSLSWFELYKILRNSNSAKDAAAALQERGIERADEPFVSGLRNKFFTMIPRWYLRSETRKRDIAAKRAARRKAQQDRLEQDPSFKHLRDVCREYGLGVPKLATRSGRYFTNFIIDGLLCHAYTTSAARKVSPHTHQMYAQFRNPLGSERPLGDFCIFLIDVDDKGVKEKAAYFVPTDVLVAAAYEGENIFIPVGERSASQAGAAQKVDWERYYARTQVRSLFDVAKQKRAAQSDRLL